eukprot:126390_1
MSYGRGKRRYNGYNGYHRNRYNSSHYNNEPHTDNGNKPFRILQRKQQGDSNNHNHNNHNNHNPVPSNHAPINSSHHNSRYNTMDHTPSNTNNDHVAAVLQNVISDASPTSNNTANPQQKVSNLGHQLLGMQRRGGRLYHYKRKDGTGSVIPIPAHHKKNYNKSIGRGKKFDKEREAALQALANQNNPDGTTTTTDATPSSPTNPTDTDASTIPVISETNVLVSDNTAPASITMKTQNEDTHAPVHAPNNASKAPTNDDARSWRRGGGGGGGRYRARGRGRGRGRRNKNYGNKHYYSRHARSTHSERWSDDDDYNRDKGYGNKHGRWDKRHSKFEPPRHRQPVSQWNKDRHSGDNTSGAFGSSVMENFGNDMTLQSPNIGPRHRHYNKKFNKLHRQLTENDGGKMASLQSMKGGVDKKHDKKGDLWDIVMDLEEHPANLELEAEVLSCYLDLNRERVSKSVPFLDVRMCTHVLGEIEELLTDCSDFTVIGVIGQQGVGKSTILSHLAATGQHCVKDDIFLNSDLSKLISSTHNTHGIQCYVTQERVIYLDCQPILSPSILFSLTNHRRRCMREKSHESMVSPMETWDMEMAKHSLFLCCICHVMLVISDSLADMDTLNFVRSIYSMRQSMKMNSFLRHDSSLRKKLKDLQTKINEKSETKKAKKPESEKHGNKAMIRPQQRHQWRRMESMDRGVLEEDAVWRGIDEAVEEDYKLYKLLNAQQRYGFPDVIFIQNKVSTFDMTPATFNEQRQFLYTMLKHQYFSKQGEVGNSELLGMMNGGMCGVNEVSMKIPMNPKKEMEKKEEDGSSSDHTMDSDSAAESMKEMANRMNCFFLPRVQSNKREFELGCQELRNQIMSMAKPQTISQSHSYKQTERDWFSFAKKIWHQISNAPNFIEYRGNHSHSTS